MSPSIALTSRLTALRRAATVLVAALTLALGVPSHAHAAEPSISFVDISQDSGVADALANSYVHAGAWGDVDGDTWPDLFVGTFVEGATQIPNALLRNDGGGFTTFPDDATRTSGRPISYSSRGSGLTVGGRSAPRYDDHKRLPRSRRAPCATTS